MSDQNEMFKEAHDYLNKLREQDGNFVIDGDTTQIGDVDLNSIMDMDFGENLRDELVVVHATDYSPSKNNAIVSTESTFRTVTDLATGKSHDSHRITVHTTLNSLVKNNNGGNWDYRMFTILEPFSNINSKVCGLGVADTFFANKIDLSDKGIVLVREEDKSKLSDKDKEMNIVYFRGNPRNAVNKAMIMMGYKPQTLEVENIKNKKNDYKIEKFRINEGYGPSRHGRTVYYKVEQALGRRDIAITSYRGINTNTCIDNRASVEEIEEILERHKHSFFFPGELGIVEVFLVMGIAFNENGPYFLNTSETIERISKYYDHEKFQMLVTEKNINNYPELVTLLNQYHFFVEQEEKERIISERQKEEERVISESYEEALNTNNILSSFPQDIDPLSFGQNDYIKQYILNLKAKFPGRSFDIKITPTSVVLYANEGESNLFTEHLFPGKVTDKICDELEIDSFKIDFDFQKSLIENLNELPDKISQIYEKLNQQKEMKANQPEENSNTGFHL